LRVLENGEFLKVGSSKVQKTDVRIVTATNKNLLKLIEEGKFREDLFYRLNTVEITLPPLRERKGDIHLLFRKFASDFAQKYGKPAVRLTPDAIAVLESYDWPGNIRQLRNVVEEISVMEEDRMIDGETLKKYLPDYHKQFPTIIPSESAHFDFDKDRKILYKLIFDLKKEIDYLKDKIEHQPPVMHLQETNPVHQTVKQTENGVEIIYPHNHHIETGHNINTEQVITVPHVEEESLSLQDREIDLIKKALEKHHGKRKKAAEELGISERTLYRKIKQYDLD